MFPDQFEEHSSGNTNGSRYEVYALLGEVSGSGMLLGYLLIQSSPQSAGKGSNSVEDRGYMRFQSRQKNTD
jgi:hypothetical protein